MGGALVLIVWARRWADDATGCFDARDGVHRLEALSTDNLLRGEGREQLEAALREFEAARDRRSSLLLGPVRPHPVIGWTAGDLIWEDHAPRSLCC